MNLFSLTLFPTLLYRSLKIFLSFLFIGFHRTYILWSSSRASSIKNQESMERTSVSFSSFARFDKESNKFKRFHAITKTTSYATRWSGWTRRGKSDSATQNWQRYRRTPANHRLRNGATRRSIVHDRTSDRVIEHIQVCPRCASSYVATNSLPYASVPRIVDSKSRSRGRAIN